MQLYKWDSNQVEPGQYTIPFSFNLPEGIPASFYQKIRRALAVIQYDLEAALKLNNQKNIALKHKRRFIIKPRENSQFVGQGVKKIKAFKSCLFSKGLNEVSCRLQSASYFPGDNAKLDIYVNNKNCKVDCIGVTIILEQRLTLWPNKRRNYFAYEIIRRSLPGIPRGEISENALVSLQLPARQSGDYACLKNKKVKELLINEPQFSSATSSTTHGNLIQSQFVLIIKAHYSGCGTEDNLVEVPFCIKAPKYELLDKVEKPPNWQPELKETVNLVLSPQYKIVKNLDESISYNCVPYISEDYSNRNSDSPYTLSDRSHSQALLLNNIEIDSGAII